ncbi:hypothetical protein [Novosphingobium resinovorum]|nr:hypothetical protein [Novosphingobium resinovorum]
MANCVSAHILIGGRLARSRYPELIEAIKADNPAVDWDGTPFDPDDIPVGKPLALMDHDVANGCFEEIEGICHRHGLHYVRWSGASPGSFPSVRIVYTGNGEPQPVLTTEEDEQVFSIERIRKLGSIETIEADYQRARRNPPPLVIVDDQPADVVILEITHG